MVLDGVRGDHERLGDLGVGQAAGEQRGDLALAGGRAERLEPDGASTARLAARSSTIATRPRRGAVRAATRAA